MQQTTTAANRTGGPPSEAAFGSDVIVEMLRALDIPYVALNPGASFRGLHDSLVNFKRGQGPEMLPLLPTRRRRWQSRTGTRRRRVVRWPQ